MLDEMTRMVEGTHVRFLRKILGKREQRNTYDMFLAQEAG